MSDTNIKIFGLRCREKNPVWKSIGETNSHLTNIRNTIIIVFKREATLILCPFTITATNNIAIFYKRVHLCKTCTSSNYDFGIQNQYFHDDFPSINFMTYPSIFLAIKLKLKISTPRQISLSHFSKHPSTYAHSHNEIFSDS